MAQYNPDEFIERESDNGIILLEKTRAALEFLKAIPKNIAEGAYSKKEKKDLDYLMETSEDMQSRLNYVGSRLQAGMPVPTSIEELIDFVEDTVSEIMIETSHLPNEDRSQELFFPLCEGTFASYLRNVAQIAAELMQMKN
jgi:hypothetical protein